MSWAPTSFNISYCPGHSYPMSVCKCVLRPVSDHPHKAPHQFFPILPCPPQGHGQHRTQSQPDLHLHLLKSANEMAFESERYIQPAVQTLHRRPLLIKRIPAVTTAGQGSEDPSVFRERNPETGIPQNPHTVHYRTARPDSGTLRSPGSSRIHRRTSLVFLRSLDSNKKTSPR